MFDFFVERLWDFLTTVTTVTAVTTVFFIFIFYFLSTFGKIYLKHLTTDVMFSWQGFAILAMFFWEVVWFCVSRGYVIFVCWEVVWFSYSFTPVAWFIFLEVSWFFLWRACMIFLWRGCMIFFGLKGCSISFVERLRDFVFGEVVWLLSLTHSGCMIYFCEGCVLFFAEVAWFFYVERLRDFFWFEVVAWFFVWRGCVLFGLKRFKKK